MMMPLVFSAPPFLTASLLAGLAAITLCRGRRQPFKHPFALLCFFGCLLNMDILIQLNALSAEFALRSTRLFHLFHPFLVPLFIHFLHAYLHIADRNWILGLAYASALVVAACSQGHWVIAATRQFSFGYAAQGGPLYGLMAAGAIFATTYNLIILSGAIRKEKRSAHKNKLKYIYTGLLSLGVLTCMNLLTRFGWGLYPPGNFGFIPLGIFAAGVLKYDLLDLGILIRRSLLYFVLTLLLSMFYTLGIVAVQALFKETRMADSVLFAVFFFAVIAFFFGPLKSRLQSLIDQWFARKSYDYRQTIKQASRVIASVLDYERISTLLKDTLIGAMRVEHGALFLGDSSGEKYAVVAAVGRSHTIPSDCVLDARNALVLSLAGNGAPLVRRNQPGSTAVPCHRNALAAMVRLNAEIVLPMVFQQRLNGFVVLGEKLSGDMYFPDDLDLLETLAHQSALAVENARAYEALNALNRNLEDRVVSRTRELSQALEEKERTQEQLVRSESLAAIGQLVAGVAHELNNPLASVTSLLQSTVEDLQAWDPADQPNADLIDDLHFADKELARAKSIVASLLGLARQTQTYEEAVNLNTVVKDALRIMHNRYKHKQLEIVHYLAPNLGCLQGNFANLGQVVVNILTNAIQAAPRGDGKIILRTALADRADAVLFTCEDNGSGIDQSIRQDVFKPFFTTKPVGKGTGLGLYICHEIIKKHGGSMVIESSGLQGAAIKVKLPLNGHGRHRV